MGSRERFLTIGQKKKKNGKTSFLALHTAVCLETKLHIPIFVLLLLVALIDFYANVIKLNTSLTSRSDSSSSKKSEEKKKNKKNPRAKTRTKKKKHAHTDAHTAHHPRSLNVIPRKTHKTPVGLAGPACMLPRPIINDGLLRSHTDGVFRPPLLRKTRVVLPPSCLNICIYLDVPSSQPKPGLTEYKRCSKNSARNRETKTGKKRRKDTKKRRQNRQKKKKERKKKNEDNMK